ncbi:hypothetical protein KAU11_07035, partial [Candidatus Babeliales bacterium]|nr:hypothetical protein [Candidatus Babeliales bacterium]
GIIPKKLNNTILPFLNKQNEYVYYKAYFNKSSELLTLELHRTTEKEVRMKKERNEKKAQESEEKLQAEYEKKLNRDYKLKKDLEEYVNLGTSDALKGKRKFGNLTLEFYEKSKYLNRRFNEAKLFENDKFLCKINLDIRIIRTFYSGHELTVKTCKIERERSYGSTFTYLRPTIGVIDES